MAPTVPAGRATLLLACLAAGAAVAAAGGWWTGDERWALAIPVPLALAWLRLADPTQCDRPHGPPGHGGAAGSPPRQDGPR